MDTATLLSLPAEFAITAIEAIDETLTFQMASTRRCTCCPLCGQQTTRVHSTYRRTVADVPCGAKQVHFTLQVHKFFCDNAMCVRKIFVERIVPFLAPWARKTERLNRSLQSIGLATCGKLGARLAQRLSMPTSWMTILRRILAISTSSDDSVVHLGVDDFAFRRGRRYGSILINLDAHRICDLLPDRETETVARWMLGHPEIDLVSRDRGEAFAAAARQGAPQATQVTDRFHLMKNLVETIAPVVTRCLNNMRPRPTPLPTSQEPLPPDEWRPAPKNTYEPIRLARLAVNQDRFEQAMALKHHGFSTTQVAQRLGVSARTVRYWMARGYGPDAQRRRKRHSPFDRFAPYLARRWHEGCHDVSQLWDEIRTQGYPNSLRTFYRYIQTLRQQSLAVLPDPSPIEGLTAQDALWLVVRSPEALTEQERTQLDDMKQSSAQLDQLYQLVQSFRQMVRHREGHRFASWVNEVHESDFAELHRFVKGLTKDTEAVVAGLTERYSNGMVEGFVNKVKMVKRVMFGKAGFPLLRQRVLHAL